MQNKTLPIIFLIGCGGGSFVQREIGAVEDTGSSEGSTVESNQTDDTENIEENPQEDTAPEFCKNDYHPVHLSGWSKEYIARYEEDEGIAIEESMDALENEAGDIYRYRDILEISTQGWFGTKTSGWDTVGTVSCDHEGKMGMFLLGWEGIYQNDDTWNREREINATHSLPKKYLPSEYSIGYEGEWEYDYELLMQVKNGSEILRNVVGLYQEIGFQNITLFDGQTVEAYKVVNSFQMIDPAGREDTQESYIEQFWVKGLGLVRETHLNLVDDSEVMFKELSAYSGLEVIQQAE